MGWNGRGPRRSDWWRRGGRVAVEVKCGRKNIWRWWVSKTKWVWERVFLSVSINQRFILNWDDKQYERGFFILFSHSIDFRKCLTLLTLASEYPPFTGSAHGFCLLRRSFFLDTDKAWWDWIHQMHEILFYLYSWFDEIIIYLNVSKRWQNSNKKNIVSLSQNWNIFVLLIIFIWVYRWQCSRGILWYYLDPLKKHFLLATVASVLVPSGNNYLNKSGGGGCRPALYVKCPDITLL